MDTADQKPENILLNQFINYIRYERQYSVYTQRNYHQAVRDFLSWHNNCSGEKASLCSITSKIIRDYIIESQTRLSRRTLHNQISAIRAFFQYLLRHKHITSNPLTGLPLPKMEKLLPKSLTEKQIYILLKSPIVMLKSNEISEFEAWRDRLALELIYGGGLRVSEAANLNYSDINFPNGTARILGKGNKERICPLGKVALACLKHFKCTFGHESNILEAILLGNNKKRIKVTDIQKLIKRHLKRSNLPLDITPHKIRHSYATHMLNHGADLRLLQELLGHSSLSATQIYTHVDSLKLKQIHQKAHPRG